MKRLRVSISTVGCRANQADSDALARGLDGAAVEVVKGRGVRADLVAINTCCVTSEAERDSRKAARRALASNPDARVVVFGCAVRAIPGFAESLGERVKALEEMEPTDLAARMNRFVGAGKTGASVRSETVGASGRARALLRIQNGCSHRCAYCVVPLARGSERSMSPENAIDAAERLADQGFNEVVLTGVQLGAWGKDLDGRPKLCDLVSTIAGTVAPARIRLSSIEPWSVDDALIDAIADNERICPHLHIPLQSGDDRILDAMGRGYTAEEYLGLIERVRRRIPDVALGADVILGFPGEDDQAFDNTLKTLEQARPAYVHAFPFSPRSGTRAQSMLGRPPRSVAKDRVVQVRRFSEASARAYREKQIGQVREVLVERRKGSTAGGLTENYVQVVLDSAGLETGDLVFARMDGIREDGRVSAATVTPPSTGRSNGSCKPRRRAGRTG